MKRMQTYVNYGLAKINYTVTRRKRKTLGISISVDNGVQVAAPYMISDDIIGEIVLRKAPWILEKLSHLKEIKEQTPLKHFVSGEVFPYMGREYKLQIIIGNYNKGTTISFEDSLIKILIPDAARENQSEVIREELINFYKNNAKELFLQRIEYFSKKLGVTHSGLTIKGQKTIWGSCTKANKINLNWKILMAPLDIIDYLVVHELAHIRVKNHSRDFWNLVGLTLPDYKKRSNWLKTNGHKLNF